MRSLLFSFFVILCLKKYDMRSILCFLLCLLVFPVFSQEKESALERTEVKIDSLYREDQFYFSFTLNTLQNKPVNVAQDKFSSGYAIGFLRDFPLNKTRNFAIAPGIGFVYNNYNQNLKITESNQVAFYSVIESNVAYTKNKFSQLLVEVPIELRWRTSNAESYKFWRIYGGFKLGYLLYDRSIYEDSQGKIVMNSNKDFNKFQYGTYLSVGYNSINVFAYYGLNPLFESAQTSTEKVEMNALAVGIMFYVL